MKKFFEKFKKQANLTTQALIVAAIIVVINFFSYQLFARFDLTKNKIYSLSDTSKKAVKNLDDIVNIKVYFSQNLPPQYLNARREVQDILDEYKNYANNKLAVEFIDPKDDEKLQRELEILGIPMLQFNVLENDRYEIINGYLGMALQYGDNKQPIPVVNSTENFEYQLTAAIKKITVSDIPVIGFAAGHGERGLNNELRIASQKLSDIYTLRDIDLSNGEAVPGGVNTLILAGPKETFTERGQYVIDQFIMMGGNAVFLIDGVDINENLQAAPNEAALDKLLNAYGIKIEKYFVLDSQNDYASFNKGFFSFTVQYPFFVKVNPSGFNQKHAAVAKLSNLILPWASPLSITNGQENSIEPLAWTTNQAWLMENSFNLNPESNFGFKDDPNAYNLILARLGNINSAFSGYVPKNNETGEHLSSTENGRVIVVGDADFITDTFVQRYPDNLVFLQNIVDYFALDNDLINIRAKEVSDRPLSPLEDSVKNIIKYFNIFGVTVIVLAFGLIRYFMRRKKNKFADEL